MSTSYLKSPTSSSTSSFSSQEHIPLNPPTLSSTSTSSTSSYSVLQGSLSSLLWRTLQHVKKKLVGDVVDDCCWYFVVCIVLKKLFSSFARELLVLLMICWCCSKMQMTGLMWSNTVVVCKGKMAAELDTDVQVKFIPICLVDWLIQQWSWLKHHWLAIRRSYTFEHFCRVQERQLKPKTSTALYPL